MDTPPRPFLDSGTADASAFSRRGVLLGLAAVPALVALGAGPAAATASAAGPARPAAGAAAPPIRRGGVRQYRPPLVQPGFRLRMPDGIAVSHGAPRSGDTHVWPRTPVAGGGNVDLSLVPVRGAPSQTAYLSGFQGAGWYEITDLAGRVVVSRSWDAHRFPGLLMVQEWGASGGFPTHGAFFVLRLEPFSANPLR